MIYTCAYKDTTTVAALRDENTTKEKPHGLVKNTCIGVTFMERKNYEYFSE